MSISKSVESISEIIMTKNCLTAEEEFEKKSIRRLIRKLDFRLLPFMFVLEVGSYINRMSIGHVKVMGIENDLNLSQSESNWSISIFFIAYLIFAIPSNIFMRYLGPTGYLSLSMITWGGITIGMAFVKNALQLLTLRVLLGIVQAGFFPSIIIYFSLWYRKRDQTMRISILYGGAIISGALSGILAYGFRQMNDICGLKGWQWMFLLEGLPLIPLGLITYLFLNSIPDTVQWLDNCEKQDLTNLLRRDEVIIRDENTRLSWRQIYYVFIDYRIYLYGIISVGIMGVIKYVEAYLPLVVYDMFNSKSEVHLMTSPPYVFALICSLLVCYSSSQFNEHGFHLIFCLLIVLIGFILIFIFQNKGFLCLYISNCIACSGLFSAFPVLVSWLTINVGGHSKKCIAIAFVMGIGQIGGIVFPLLPHDESMNRRSNLICIVILVICLILTIILRICLMLENRRRDLLSPEESKVEASIKEPCDWHPQLRYLL